MSEPLDLEPIYERDAANYYTFTRREGQALMAEVERLRAELARRDEQITAVRALCDRLSAAQKGWRGVLNMAALHVPTASAHEILAALDGGAS